MIERLIEEKLLYKRGKKILVNQTNAVRFLKDKTVSLESKKNFLDYIRVLEDYNAINALVKNFDQYDKKLTTTILNLIKGLPFSKIEDNLERLINHRDINVRINTLKALGNLLNPEILKMVEPYISHSNPELRMPALKTFYRIVFNNTVNEYTTLISSNDEHIKKSAYKNLLELTSLHKEMEELKNITYFDSDLESIEKENEKDLKKSNGDEPKNVDVSELYERLSRMEKNSGYSFATLLSISLILILIIFMNFHVMKTSFSGNNTIAKNDNSYNKIVVPSTSIANQGILQQAYEALKNNEPDRAEELFLRISDRDTRTINLFNILMKKGSYEKAAYHFLNLSRYSADNLDEYSRLLKEIVRAGDRTLAIEIGERLIYFNSKDINRVLVDLYKQVDIEKALIFASIHNIRDVELLLEAAEMFSEKDIEKSIALYKEALTMIMEETRKQTIIENLLKLSDGLDKNARLSLLKELRNEFRNNRNILIKLLSYHKEEQNITDALDVIDILLKDDPDNKKLLKDKTDLLQIIAPE